MSASYNARRYFRGCRGRPLIEEERLVALPEGDPGDGTTRYSIQRWNPLAHRYVPRGTVEAQSAEEALRVWREGRD